MQYKELKIELTPFSEEYSEILIAMIEDLGFESYSAENPCLLAYIQESVFDRDLIAQTLDALEFPDFTFSWTINDVQTKNWNAEWESSFEPVVIEKLCTIKATYHHDLPPTRFTITINPEMAFGTGHHQTTTLMAGALIENYAEGDPDNILERTGLVHTRQIQGLRLLDMGCGTGILGILAAQMGAEVTAIDIDDTARDSAISNAQLNHVAEKMDIYCGDASLLPQFETKPFDILLANINRNILLNDLHIYSSVLKSGAELYMSGFYEEDILLLENQARKFGLEPSYTRTLAPWSLIKLIKK